MSLLAELNTVLSGLGLPVETGVFSGEAPDEYVVITPMSDVFEVYANNIPHYEVKEARVSLFSKGNYTKLAGDIARALLAADIMITDRRYIGHDHESGYHGYAIDVAKESYFSLEI